MKYQKSWKSPLNNRNNSVRRIFFCKFFSFCLLFFLISAVIAIQTDAQNLKNDLTHKQVFPPKFCADLLKSSKIKNVSRIASDNLTIFLASDSGKVIRLNQTGNDFEWLTDLGGQIISDLIFEQGRIYAITELTAESSKQILWSLDAQTGVTIWQTPLETDGSAFFSIYAKRAFITSKSGRLQAINILNGELLLKKDLSTDITAPPIFYENRIFIAVKNRLILIMGITDFEIKDRISTSQTAATILKASENKLFWGEQNGILSLFDLSVKKRIWSNRYGGEISNIDVTEYGALTSSFDNFIYLNSLSNGKLIWKKRLPGRIAINSLIVGDQAFFVTTGDYNVITVDLNKRKIINQISSGNFGEVIAKPVALGDALLLLTSKSLFIFSKDSANCSE